MEYVCREGRLWPAASVVAGSVLESRAGATVRTLGGRRGGARAEGPFESRPPVSAGGGGQRRVADLLRRVGRLVLWAGIGVLLIRGVGAVLSSVPNSDHRALIAAAVPADLEAQAFAVRFSRAYLSWRHGAAAQHSRALGPFFSSDVRDRAAATLPRRGPGQLVAQATVARSQDLGSGRALITVASELAAGGTVFLTVPVARDGQGGLDVFALPALTAPPPPGSSPAIAPDPPTGADAGEIQALVQRFLAAYVSGRDPSGLAYLVAPGAVIAGRSPGLRLESLDHVGQLSIGGARMVVEADVHVGDRASGASYPLAYRLDLEHRDRWYVAGVEGGPQK